MSTIQYLKVQPSLQMTRQAGAAHRLVTPSRAGHGRGRPVCCVPVLWRLWRVSLWPRSPGAGPQGARGGAPLAKPPSPVPVSLGNHPFRAEGGAGLGMALGPFGRCPASPDPHVPARPCRPVALGPINHGSDAGRRRRGHDRGAHRPYRAGPAAAPPPLIAGRAGVSAATR